MRWWSASRSIRSAPATSRSRSRSSPASAWCSIRARASLPWADRGPARPIGESLALPDSRQPKRIEPAIGLPVIGQPRDVPVLDETGIGGEHRRSAADENHAARICGDGSLGRERRADLHDRAFRIGEFWHRAFRARSRQDDMAARHVPEALHVRDVFGAFGAFPRQHTVEPELAPLADGAHGTNVGHDALPGPPPTLLHESPALACDFPAPRRLGSGKSLAIHERSSRGHQANLHQTIRASMLLWVNTGGDVRYSPKGASKLESFDANLLDGRGWIAHGWRGICQSPTAEAPGNRKRVPDSR